MKPSTRFVTTTTGVVFAGSTVSWPFLAGDARGAVLASALLALGTQIPMYFLLKGWRSRNDRFLAAIGLAFAGRVAVLAAAIFIFVVPGRVPAAPFLLALGGFLVAILFAESILESRRIRSGVAVVRP
ncbi:MAG: hypothetical protein OXE96_11160 [Gemmatimonadetes bacterium]|nr:hypothetical protein [Gemmatimonadota bacterium]